MFQSRLRQVGVPSLRGITVTRPGTLVQVLAKVRLWTNRWFQNGLIVEPRQHPNPHWEAPKVKVANVSNHRRTRNRQFQLRSPDLIAVQRQQSSGSGRPPRLMRKHRAVVAPPREPHAATPVTGPRVRTRMTCYGSKVRRREFRSIRVRGRRCGRTASAAWNSISGQGGSWSGATWMGT